MSVPAQVYDFPDEDIDFVTERFRELLRRRRFLTLGSFVEQFEEDFAGRHRARYAVATSSGTSALEATLRAIDVEGGEVILPTNTFAATAFAVVRAGARPVFADILPDLTLDPRDAAACTTPATRAIVTVHIGGLVSPATEELADACRRHDLPLVEDAAHAHGSALGGRPAGTFGVAGAFSFFSTKVMTTGEGGMVLTDDEHVRDTARLLRDQAKVDGRNEHEMLGDNWRLTEVQALLGITQLRRLDEFIGRRQEVAGWYDAELAGVPGLRPLAVPEGVHHNFYKYVAFLDGLDPQALKRALKEKFAVSLGGFVYEKPLHEQPAFQAWRDRPLPVAEDLCRRHICPPIYPSLTKEEVTEVAGALRQELEVAAS